MITLLTIVGGVIITLLLIWLTLSGLSFFMMSDESLVNTIKWNFFTGWHIEREILLLLLAAIGWWFWGGYLISHVDLGWK